MSAQFVSPAVSAFVTALDCSEPALDLWLVDLDHEGGCARELLDARESEQAARFRFENLARRYVAAHVAVRQLLGHRLGRPGSTLHFGIGAYGKPFVADAPGLHFNLSHSGRWGLVGIHRHCALGVDIEVVRDHGDMQALARQTFAAGEIRALCTGSRDSLLTRFLACWTRKEAAIKAIGSGFSLEPQEFDTGDGLSDVPLRFEGRNHRVRMVAIALPPGVDALAAAAWQLT